MASQTELKCLVPDVESLDMLSLLDETNVDYNISVKPQVDVNCEKAKK